MTKRLLPSSLLPSQAWSDRFVALGEVPKRGVLPRLAKAHTLRGLHGRGLKAFCRQHLSHLAYSVHRQVVNP